MRILNSFNRRLDRVVRPEIHITRRSWPAFQFCLLVGLAPAAGLVMILAIRQGLSPWIMTWVIALALALFFATPLLDRRISGQEGLIYYHAEVMILGATALLLWSLGQPVLPYLDALILGIGVCLATSRVGCLLVGCCYGRPSRWGACYHLDHAAYGFPRYYIGVRLFPIQMVESLWVCFVVAVGSSLVLLEHVPGAVLAWYIVSYGAGRFWFEQASGYTARSYLAGFSEAQWTAELLILAVACAELLGALPFTIWHLAVACALPLSMVLLVLADRWWLLLPQHLGELVDAAEHLSRRVLIAHEPEQSRETVYSAQTSLGVRLTATTLQGNSVSTVRYTVSDTNGYLPRPKAQAIAELIVSIGHSMASYTLFRRDRGSYHLLVTVNRVADELVFQPQVSRAQASGTTPAFGHQYSRLHIHTDARPIDPAPEGIVLPWQLGRPSEDWPTTPGVQQAFELRSISPSQPAAMNNDMPPTETD
jgi:hypothetical protein